MGDVYVRAYGGSLGYVKDTRIDEFEFEKIYISWDRKDWRYNGQKDGWTYASHFTLKEMPKKEEKSNKIEELDAFMSELQKGLDAASGAEGFVLVVAKRVPAPDGVEGHVVVPELYSASHSQEADTILGITLMEHLTATFQDMSIALLEIFSGDGNKPDM